MFERFAGRYGLLRRLGAGGMGEVFLARDLATGAACALKRLRPHADPGAAATLRSEFETLQRVRHPAVVQVLDFGLAADGTPWLTMEYVPGVGADRAVACRDWDAIAYVGARIADGLEALHAGGVAHGDLKPSNVLVTLRPDPPHRPATVRLVDFGLAAHLGTDAEGHRGTPGFTAPEVVRGAAPSPRADLYGLGATLYALALGHAPFAGEDGYQVLRLQQSGPPPAEPLEQSGAPWPLIEVILRLMAPDPAGRPADAREARRALERAHRAARRPLAERLQHAVLAGRERELAELEQWAARPSSAERAIVLMGPPGIGKSALISEFAARATLAGRRPVVIRCAGTDATGAVALAGARAIAAHGQPVAPRQLLATQRQVPDLEELVEVTVACAREAGAQAGELLVLLDDLESLDTYSATWLRLVMLHPSVPPLRWVFARRRIGGAAGPLRLLVESGLARTLRLWPLDRDGAAVLLASRLGAPAPRALEEFVWSRSGGHPGLAVELLRAAADAGAIAEDDTGVLVHEDVLANDPPPTFEAAREARLAGLRGPARRVAAVIAAAGSAVREDFLRELVPDHDPGTLEHVLDTGFVIQLADGSLSWTATDLAEHLLGSLPAADRVAIHRALLDRAARHPRQRFRHRLAAGDVAGALAEAERAWEEHPEDSLARLAATAAAGHDDAVAATWHERTARRCIEQGRYDAAIAPLERSLAGAGGADDRARRWGMLSTAMLRARSADATRDCIALALAESPGPAERALLLTNRGAAHLRDGDQAAARRDADDAFALAGAAGHTLHTGLAAELRAASEMAGPDPARAEPWITLALDTLARGGHEAQRLRALTLSIARARRNGSLAEAERLAREGVEAARALHNRHVTVALLLQLLAVIGAAGRWAEMREPAAEAVRLSLEDLRPSDAAMGLATLAMVEATTGRPRDARRHARTALRLGRRHWPAVVPSANRALALAQRALGRTVAASRAIRRALRLAARTSAEEQRWTRLEMGFVEADRDDWAAARDHWETALREAGETWDLPAALAAACLGRAELRRPDRDAAARQLERVERWLAAHPTPAVAATAAQLATEISLAGGRAEEAVARAQQALAAWERLGAPVERARAAAEFARLAPDDDALRGPVQSWLGEAATAAERLGNHRLREKALAIEVKWLRRQPPVITPVHDLQLLERVSWLLHALADLDLLLSRSMKAAVEQLGAERGLLLLGDPETGDLMPMAEHGALDSSTRAHAVGYSRGVVRQVTESGDSLLVEDAAHDPRVRSQSVLDLNLRSILCVPMVHNGRVIGVVYLDDSRRPRSFGEPERAMMESFANLMALAIDRSRREDEVRKANERLETENLTLRRQVGAAPRWRGVVGSSAPMQAVLDVVAHAARVNATVLITGENGTGKELIARSVHQAGKRSKGPFVIVNCGAISESLLESELFGIRASIATGVRARPGRFEQANGGTLFLDEIGEMPLAQQVALLSVLSNREITPVGGGRAVPVDVRIVAATNRDLAKLVEQGGFRRDLYYRLNVLEIRIPPLRERKADIPALTRHFLEMFSAQQERPVPELAPDFLPAVMRSDWPGNVRELQNYIERVLAMTHGRTLRPVPLPPGFESRGRVPRMPRDPRLRDAVRDVEYQLLLEALERSKGNQSHAARELGLSEQAVRYRIRKYGLASKRRKPRRAR